MIYIYWILIYTVVYFKFMLLIVGVLNYKYKKKPWIIIACICGICLYFVPIYVCSIEERESMKYLIISFGCSFVSVVFISEFTFFLKVCNAKKNAEKKVLLVEKILAQQESYYLEIIEKEEETKKFRHDVHNHISCLKHLTIEKDYDELEQYLYELDNSMSVLKSNISTGHHIVNILIDEIIMNKIEKDVNFTWKGVLPKEVMVPTVDMCIIFSNLLLNAIEATTKDRISKKKYIDIQVKNTENSTLIIIRNSSAEKAKIETSKIITSKLDKKLHGLGSQNIKRCVEKNEGSVIFTSSSEEFIAKVILPVKEYI